MMLQKTNDVVPLQFAYPCCGTCDLRPVCPARLAAHKKRPSFVTDYNFPLSRGDHLYRQGDPVKALYVVRSGSLKSCVSMPNGAHHVVRFHLPGDVVALDALGCNDYPSSVQALETTGLCQIATAALAEGGDAKTVLPAHLLKLASLQVVREQRRALILSQRDASERVALFLLQLSQRYSKRGLSRYEFTLNMSRREIASYLALTIETVSRMCTLFQSMGLIGFDHRRVRLLSLERLRKMAKAEHLWLVL